MNVSEGSGDVEVNVNSPHASGKGSVAAGRDALSKTKNTAAGEGQVAVADRGSAASTGKARAKVEQAPPQAQRQRLAALIFFVILVVGIVLLIVGVQPAIAAIVIGGGGFALNIYKLARGT